MDRLFRTFAMLLIKAYRWGLSPILGNQCRFHPTCSVYALEAFEKYCFTTALYMSVKRIVKCQPFYHGDPIDPVR